MNLDYIKQRLWELQGERDESTTLWIIKWYKISKNNISNRSDNYNVLDICRENTTPINYRIYVHFKHTSILMQITLMVLFSEEMESMMDHHIE